MQRGAGRSTCWMPLLPLLWSASLSTRSSTGQPPLAGCTAPSLFMFPPSILYESQRELQSFCWCKMLNRVHTFPQCGNFASRLGERIALDNCSMCKYTGKRNARMHSLCCLNAKPQSAWQWYQQAPYMSWTPCCQQGTALRSNGVCREAADCHQYGKGRVTLLGDAAHLTAAALGQVSSHAEQHRHSFCAVLRSKIRDFFLAGVDCGSSFHSA